MILSASLIVVFSAIFSSASDLPSLKDVDSNFPSSYFCQQTSSQFIGEPDGEAYVAQCGLLALRIVRHAAKVGSDSELQKIYKELYREFANQIPSLTYIVSKYSDSNSEVGVNFYQARRKCQVCGGRLANSQEASFYQTVSQVLIAGRAQAKQEAVLNSKLGYWFEGSGLQPSTGGYTVTTCTYFDGKKEQSTPNCVSKKQFLCTFDQPIIDECLEKPEVCVSPWSVSADSGNARGCPAYNTLRPDSQNGQKIISKRNSSNLARGWFIDQFIGRSVDAGDHWNHSRNPFADGGEKAEIEERVIGGIEVKSGNKWPFFASIGRCGSGCVPFGPSSKVCVDEIRKGTCEVGSFDHKCGGVVLDQFWVLTAGHCFENQQFNPQMFYVATGSSKNSQYADFTGKLYKVKRIYVHPKYVQNSYEMYNDIALVQIDSTWDGLTSEAERQQGMLFFTAGQQKSRSMSISPADPQQSQSSFVKDGHFATLVGFGMTHSAAGVSSPVLNEVALQLHDCAQYNLLYKPGLEICAGDSSSNICGGDSGGPLLCDNVDGSFNVCGVVSRAMGGHNSCTSSPAVFTNVSHYSEWIETTMTEYS